MLRLNNIKIREDLSDYEVLKLSIKKYKIDESDITKWFISKKSIVCQTDKNLYEKGRAEKIDKNMAAFEKSGHKTW